jgi:hypothetical protein
MPGNGKVDSPTFMGNYAMNQGNIFLFDGSIFELLRKRLMGHIVFGNNHEPGGVFIEPVNDAGPECSPNA